MTFDELPTVSAVIDPPVRVRAIKDLYSSRGYEDFLHVKEGTEGTITHRTNVGFIVKFDDGNQRQVFDFQGEKRLYRAEDEIALI